MALSCMSIVVERLEAWRTHGKPVWGWYPTPNPNSLVVEEEEKNLFDGIEKRGRKERNKGRKEERKK